MTATHIANLITIIGSLCTIQLSTLTVYYSNVSIFYSNVSIYNSNLTISHFADLRGDEEDKARSMRKLDGAARQQKKALRAMR